MHLIQIKSSRIKVYFQHIYWYDKIVLEFDGDFDEIPTKYNEVLAEYPDHISFGIYDDYETDKFEGKYKIGVFIKGKKELKKGFKLGKMISSKAAIWWVDH